MCRLNEDDGQAVDMFFQTRNQPVFREPGRTPAASEHVMARLDCVGQLLDLFAIMPAPEPPRDLVARTLRRVRSSAEGPIAAPPSQPQAQI